MERADLEPCMHLSDGVLLSIDKVRNGVGRRFLRWFAKIDVNGINAHRLYQYLKSEKPGILGTEAIKWNFTKFLVGSDGTVLKRYAPSDKPETIEADLATKL
jgi:glutathione peroxidase-family protein